MVNKDYDYYYVAASGQNCNRAQGKAVSSPPENGSMFSPLSDFLWTQGNGRENAMDSGHGICADCIQL